MKLQKLKIENYRGLRELDLELDDITVLIGENNTGKTSVLDVLQTCLWALRSRRSEAFDPYDFHLANASAEPPDAPPVTLTLTFSEQQKDEWPEPVAGAFARAKVLQVHPDNDLRQLILRVKATIEPGSGAPQAEWTFLDFAGTPVPSPPAALATLHETVTFYYLSALRDAAKHFDPKGVFWRFFLRTSALQPDERAELEGSLRKVNEQVVSTHKAFEVAKGKLERLQDIVPLASGTTVSIDALPARLSDMLGRTQVSVGPTDGSKIPIARHGEGTQSLAVVMLFHAFLEATKAGTSFLALEEPEAHLHPSAIRSLWAFLADLPGQKVITTHSGDLISEVPLTSLRRLCRTSGGIKAHRLNTSALDQNQLRQFEFHVRHSRGELLFARCWLLVEGETEVTLLPAVARRLATPLERFGVRCVTYRQADIGLYLAIAKQLGINWCLLCDSDSQGQTDRTKANAARTLPEADVIFAMPGNNIEEYLVSTGFLDVYESRVAEQKKATITATPGDAAYPRQVLDALPSRSGTKTSAAMEVATRIANGAAIPDLLKRAVEAAITLARGT